MELNTISNQRKDIKLKSNEPPKRTVIMSMRQQKQLVTGKQPAQDRLKRLQTNLKEIDAKKPNKDTRKRDNHVTSRYSNYTSNTSNCHTKTSASSYSQPRKSYIAVKNVNERLREPAARISSAETTKSLPPNQRLSRAAALQASIKDAWVKPKALLDAEHKLKSRTPRLSANDRLASLRAGLQQQQKQTESKIQTERPQEQPKPPPSAFVLPTRQQLHCLRRPQQMLHEQQQRRLRRLPSRCVQRPAATDEETEEPMDWEANEPVAEAVSKHEHNNMTLLRRQDEQEQQDDHNMPLLRLLPYNCNDESLPARLTDHMYFVLDTNVLVHDLPFVEMLTKVVLQDTVGSMLYIPYIVIKELDRLKDRLFQSNEHTRQCAIRAIRYLNKKFDECLNIQAQSAIEEVDHLIDVDSPDDSIINCCLQLKPQVDHMRLLSNDNNLRLKAIASGISASDTPSLLYDHSHAFDAIKS